MDRLLRRELDAIARDRLSGAAELALGAVTALQWWLRRRRNPREEELLDIAGTLLRAQPSMAPLLRLANEVALAIDAKNPAAALAASAAGFGRVLATSTDKIANSFLRALPRGRHWFMTYSYSSTVVKALIRARSRIRIVYCSEGRPGYEGRITAAKLHRARVCVCLKTDVALFSMAPFGHVVLGADKVLKDGFENKVGTEVLVERARLGAVKRGMKRLRFWVLADTTKFWPGSVNSFSPSWKPMEGSGAKVWKDAPNRLRVSNNNPFSSTRFFPRIRVLTERGWMTPAQVRRELKKIRISPRLKELAD